MGFFFWKKKQEPQSTEGEISPPPSDSSLNPSPENKDRKTQKAERYFNKGLEFLNSTSYKDRALQQFINAGNLGYIDAIHYIGLCYFKGYGTPSNPERAVEIWQKNVLKKNPLTQYMLGYCYFHGIGIERNRIVARAYLKTAEALGNTDASILLKEDIPSQASSASANYQPSVTTTKSHPSESQTPAYQLNTTTPWDARNIARSFSPSLNTQKEETSPQSSKTATKSHPSESQSPTSQTPAYQLNTTTPWDARNIARSFSPSLNTQKEETSGSQPSASPLPRFDSSFVLFEEADILYKHALAYYVGDITNRTNITKYMNYLRIAEELGSKQAAFLLKTKESFCYTHLEAARYGSKKAEKHISYIASTGGIPVDIVTQYVRYINARTPSDDYYKFSNTSPDIAQKVYQRGLSYWVGDVYSWTDGTKGNEYLRIARDLGSHDAEFILNSEHKRLYIYLEAAKYGSLKAKKKVREWNDKKTFAGKIPDEKLREYFQTIGLPTAGIKSAEEFFQEGLRQETSLSQSSKTATPKLDSSFVLFKEADMLYKRALAYYVGDINGKFDSKNFHDYLELAVQFGSEQAKFLLNTDEKHYYAHLDAARYGSAEAKRYMQQGEVRRRLIGRIPGDILRQYFNFIDSNETSTYYYRTGHVPSQKYVEELYHLGLSYLVGDVTGRKNVSKSDACLQIAKDSGSQDAKFILDSPCKERYIYLEAAKYGSERAKRKVIELNQKGEFNGSIPDEKLKEYFQEIGLTITKFKSVTDSDAEKKSSSGKISEKIIIDYSSANPDELYKDGLAYFVGDKTGRENTKEGTDLIFKASLQGSKEASFIFKTNDPYTYIFLEAAKYGSERARKRVIEWNKIGFLNKIPQKRRQEYFSAIGITEVSQAIPNEQKKSLAKDAVTKKDTAKPAPKEKQPKSTPKKPKKQEKIVIDKERLQEVKAEHLYIQNRLAIDYGDDEPSVVSVSVPLTLETPAKAEAGGEWEQMRRALSKTHIQIISALLEEPGNITKQHDIAKSGGTMLDILYDEINEISDEILGDLLIDEGELVEEYIEDVKSLCQ